MERSYWKSKPGKRGWLDTFFDPLQRRYRQNVSEIVYHKLVLRKWVCKENTSSLMICLKIIYIVMKIWDHSYREEPRIRNYLNFWFSLTMFSIVFERLCCHFAKFLLKITHSLAITMQNNYMYWALKGGHILAIKLPIIWTSNPKLGHRPKCKCSRLNLAISRVLPENEGFHYLNGYL